MEKQLILILKKLDEILTILGTQATKLDEVKSIQNSRAVFSSSGGLKKPK